jgi:hypothetical protein
MKLSDEEFLIFEIAETLRLPVYELLGEMPYDEFLGWIEYFKRRPVGWREDYRTYLLMRVQGAKQKPEQLFASLAAIEKDRIRQREMMKDGEISFDNLKRSGFFSKLRGATGGKDIFGELLK